MAFTLHNTKLSGLGLLTRSSISDSRGNFSRLFCEEELKIIDWHTPISQINLSFTSDRGTVRGMHFQFPPYAEKKIVTCLQGEIFDIVVDLRKDSPTFLKWHSEILSGENKKLLSIPEGFAHGFQALSDNCEVLYFHSAPYFARAEGGLSPVDPLLEIEWPIKIKQLSIKDASHPLLNDKFKGLEI
jgi:dTDP-4-dehydrorhamnose 3,5-epimerase